jgi:hypothetical protein
MMYKLPVCVGKKWADGLGPLHAWLQLFKTRMAAAIQRKSINLNKASIGPFHMLFNWLIYLGGFHMRACKWV